MTETVLTSRTVIAAAFIAATVAGGAGACSCGSRAEPTARATGSSEQRSQAAKSTDDAGAEVATDDDARPKAEDPGDARFASFVTDAELLAGLEAEGFAFAERAPGGPAAEHSLAAIAEDTDFGDVARILAADLEDEASRSPQAGVGMEHAHRLFDAAWLRSQATRFELVGLVSRLDRRPLSSGACGELRLVYRLAYTAEIGERMLGSRLPMTVTLDYLEDPPDDDGGCGHVAARWRANDDGDLADIPRASERLTSDRFHRLQVNAQSVRWPSAVHPSLGGHAEYILRSFVPGDAGGLEVEPLENTPDVARIADSPEARAALRSWIRDPDTLAAIDAGTAEMPAELAAARAISAAPRGLARVGNRPFSQLFDDDDFAGVDFAELEHVRSPAGLLRRLDDHSCAGCHQGRAVAGFHLLGEDRPDTATGNALVTPLSPHAASEADRRRALLAAEFAGDATPGDDYARPFSERKGGDKPGRYGAPCGLTGDPTFSAWDCGDGLRCAAYDTSDEHPHVGICLPPAPEVGDPCEVGTLRSRADPKGDRVVSAERRPCPGGAVCNVNQVGFPGGMCTTSCTRPGDAGRCGAIAELDPFNACIARGAPFDDCLADHVNPAGLRACDAGTPCRNDYLCAENSAGEGACIPPYFLFQMRVDGHPL